jgi:hypothetical protein
MTIATASNNRGRARLRNGIAPIREINDLRLSVGNVAPLMPAFREEEYESLRTERVFSID